MDNVKKAEKEFILAACKRLFHNIQVSDGA